ncbi:hypothetical protein [Streptomyces sp. NPDC015131]|uniref:hypothetical protein n=1 Tax=Streptomyces sp. NPDC015131 TaxID=3364941 RepID=UPI0036FB6A11
MGVFSRFRRKKSEPSAEETAPAPLTESEPEGAAEPEASGSAVEPDAAAVAQEPEEAAAEGVEIPKQQSAEEAADSEAGEGARK